MTPGSPSSTADPGRRQNLSRTLPGSAVPAAAIEPSSNDGTAHIDRQQQGGRFGSGGWGGVGKDLSDSSTNTGDQSVRWQASWRPAPPKSDIQG